MHKLKIQYYYVLIFQILMNVQKNIVLNVIQTRIATIRKDPTPVNVVRDTLGTVKYAQVNNLNLFRSIIHDTILLRIIKTNT